MSRPLTHPLSQPVLFEIILEPLSDLRPAQLADRIGLNLARAFAGDAEGSANFLQRPQLAIFQTVAKLEHAPFALG
jgi:hypothetical protein